MKILVTGKFGQLGYAIHNLKGTYPNFIWKFTDHSELDVTNFNNVDNVINEFMPDWIINTAAYTDVDGAEFNEALAFAVNSEGPRNLAKAAGKIGSKLFHISTDYVFDGKKSRPYTETDETNPLQVYGKSKLQGEIEIQEKDVPGIILRTSWLYGFYGNNFANTILNLAEIKDEIFVIDDQFGSPTYVEDLSITILELISNYSSSKIKLYHFSNLGEISWYLFALKIIEISKKDCLIKPISSNKYKQIAKRPNYTVMSKYKISKKIKNKISHWENKVYLYHNYFIK